MTTPINEPQDNNDIVVIDNIMPLFKELSRVLNLNITQGDIYKEVNKHIVKGADYIDKICKILKKWGVKATLKAKNYEELANTPFPSLMIILSGAIDHKIPEVKLYILTDKQDSLIQVYDTDKGYIVLKKNEVESLWFNTIIELQPTIQPIEHKQTNATSIIEEPGVSIIMPVYNYAHFIKAAIQSVISQSYSKWELIIVDDGSDDDLYNQISAFLHNNKIHYLRNENNQGLGFSLNKGIQSASYELIAYLPADDLYYDDHIETLVHAYMSTGAPLVYAGMMTHFNTDYGNGYGIKETRIDDYSDMQLVQVMHVKNQHKWLERKSYVTDDLYKMYWHVFSKQQKQIIGTRSVTCRWTNHPDQRHRIMNERMGGGIFKYKKTYKVSHPIKYQSSIGNLIDEVELYKKFRNVKYPLTKNYLKILLVGEIAYNPERIMAFEERGHQLYGLWVPNPNCINTVGPLPFGNIIDIPFDNWQEQIKKINPDIIYAQLNSQSVELAHEVLTHTNIPFVWHFKEGPFFCKEGGVWKKLVYLYTHSHGKIYNNELVREWFRMYVPADNQHEFILDGDLPKHDSFFNTPTPRLSDKDGEIHTVVAGRALGIQGIDIKRMAEQKIHFHIYGDVFHAPLLDLMKGNCSLIKQYLHFHANCPQHKWVSEFSQYDAGWMHCFESENYGDLKKASWHDLNSPARMSTYAMAGLPMLMIDNSNHRVTSQEVLENKNMALKFKSFSTLHECFDNKEALNKIRENVWNRRFEFSFDYYVDDLITFFRRIISSNTTH